MDCQDFDENLIECVRNNKCFYHRKNAGYKNPRLKLKVWEQIASQLNATVDQCRNRWKNLRDRYVRERRRMKSLPHEEHQPTWPLYEPMDFLTDFVRERGGDGNCNDDSQDEKSVKNFKIEENTSSPYSTTFPELPPKQKAILPVEVEMSPPKLAPMVPVSPPAKKKKSGMALHEEMDNNFMSSVSAFREYSFETIESEDRDVKNFRETVSRLYQELDETHRRKAKAHVIKYLGNMISDQLLDT